MPDQTQPKQTLQFNLDGVPYSVDWSGQGQPTTDQLNQLASAIRPQNAHKNAALYYNQPTIPAGINPDDVAGYSAKWFNDPANANSAPAQLLQTVQRLPLSARDAAIPQSWSPVGRAAILRAAYSANPTLPMTSQFLVNRDASELGITPDQAKRLGGTEAVKQNNITRNRLLQERASLTSGPFSVGSGANATRPYVSDKSIYTSDKTKAAANQARLDQVDAQLKALGAPQSAPVLTPELGEGALNKAFSSLVSGKDYAQADPSFSGAVLDAALGPGTNAALQTTPGFGAGLAKGVVSFVEPENLALMASGSALAKLPGASEAMLAAFGGQALKGAYDEYQRGDTGGALGGLAAFALPFAWHGLHEYSTNQTLKRVASGEIALPPKMAKMFESQLGLDKGTLKANPDMARQIAYQITNPIGSSIQTPDYAGDPYLQQMLGAGADLTASQQPAPQMPDQPAPQQQPVPAPDQPAQQQGAQGPASPAPPFPPTQQGMMSPFDIGVNPDLQYKKTGITDPQNQVTNALKGTHIYDVDQGGTWTVYRDADGNINALNSHHRRELAQRADRFVRVGPDGTLIDVPQQVPVRILDAADGWTPDRARSYGALENVRDGKGTALDALEAMQGLNITPDQFSDYGVSTTGQLARNINALGNLNPEALTRVKMGDIGENAAAGIGAVDGLSPEAQNAAMNEAIQRGFGTFDKTAALANEYLEDQKSGLLAKEMAGNQTSMFGDEFAPQVSSTRGIRVDIREAAARKVAALYRDLLMPTAADLRSGENIDVAGRQADAAQMAENSRALKERTNILLSSDAMRDEVARLAGEVGNGKLTKQQATDQIAELVRSNVGGNINHLIDPTLATDRSGQVLDTGSSVPDGNTRATGDDGSVQGAAPGTADLFGNAGSDARPEPSEVKAPETAPRTNNAGHPITDIGDPETREEEPQKNPNDLSHEVDKSVEKLSNLSTPNAKAANSELSRLERLGINVDDAREVLQQYQGLQRRDFPRGEDGNEEYQAARSDAFDDFIDELSHVDASDIEAPEQPAVKGKKGAAKGASAAVVDNTAPDTAPKKSNIVKHTIDAELAPAADAVSEKAEQAADELQQLLSPASRGVAAGKMGRMIREMGAKLAQRYEYATEALKGAARLFDKLPEAARLDFIDNIETGKGQTDPRLQKIAAALKEALDQRVEEVRALGTGHLENLVENYFPHLWEQPKGDIISRLFGKRPIEGPRSFLKQRSIPTTREGMSWRVYDTNGALRSTWDSEADANKAAAALDNAHIEAPLKPVSTNPVELTLLKMREMDKYILAQQLLQEAKRTEVGKDQNNKPAMLAKFVRATEKAPDGWKKLDDRIGTVFGGSTVDVKEQFDQQVWDKLNKLVARLNYDAPLSDTRTTKMGSGVWGQAAADGSAIKTKTGGDLSVKIHEISHILDVRYGLWDWLQKRDGSVRVKGVKGARKTISQELRALADLRFEGQEHLVSGGYRKYVRTKEEKVANALTAYIYAPEKMADVAPTVKSRLDSFIAKSPELAQIQQIKPSLVSGERTDKMSVGGLILRGHYYAPAEAADVFNQYLSPGLRGQVWYDTINGIGNHMNQAQLGLSGFHLLFTAMDSTVSKFALGIEQVGAGKFAEGAKNLAKGTVPLYAPFENYIRGSKVLSDYFAASNVSGGGQLTPIIDGLIKGGGRVRMDSFYQTGALDQFWNAMGEGRYVSATLKAPFAAIERVSKPLMETIVPRMKLGIFADLAQFELDRLPKDATTDDVRKAMARVWDTVDNRMGQMVYDNLFWDKKTKDFAMIATRSLGWNLGTIREIGGGVADAATVLKRNKANIQGAKDAKAAGLPFVPDPVITHRMAYVAALPIVVGITGALLQMGMTGQMPDDIIDCYYPRTGRFRPDGHPERVQIASYMKDVFAYRDAPLQTLGHKTHPLVSAMIDMLNNRDFYGTEIIDPDSPASQKAKDAAKFAGEQFLPFSIRNATHSNNAIGGQNAFSKAVTTAGSYVGITPAPADVDRTDAEKMLIRYYTNKLPQGARKPEEVAATDARKNIRELSYTHGDARGAARAAVESGQLTKREALAAINQGQQPPLSGMFKMLDAQEALNVYEAAAPDDRKQFAKALNQKLVQYVKQHGRDNAVIQKARSLGVVR